MPEGSRIERRVQPSSDRDLADVCFGQQLLYALVADGDVDARVRAVVKELIATFETDWAQTELGQEREEQRDKAHGAVETDTLAAAAPASA